MFQRTNFMCGSLIFGAFFILFGLSIFVNIIFGIDIPVGRIFLGLWMLYLGLSFITGFSLCNKTGGRCCSAFHGTATSHTTWFGSADIHLDSKIISQPGIPHEFSTVFGSTVLDLSHLKQENFTQTNIPLMLTVNTVFGKTVIKINKDIPITITSKSSFASSVLPDQSNTSFGSSVYNSHPHSTPAQIIMTTNTVFGETRVVKI